MDEAEEIEHAERAKREPERTRRLRRIGAGVAMVAAALCLFAIRGDRWWWMEFGTARMYVGASDARLCTEYGHCQDISREELAHYVVKFRGGTAEDANVVDDWLAGGTSVMLGFVLVAAAGLGGLGALSRRHKGTRVMAVTTAVLALMALVPLWRFAGSAPVFFFHRGVHAYIAFAGVFAALAAAALVGFPPTLVTPPTARVVKRG